MAQTETLEARAWKEDKEEMLLKMENRIMNGCVLSLMGGISVASGMFGMLELNKSIGTNLGLILYLAGSASAGIGFGKTYGGFLLAKKYIQNH